MNKNEELALIYAKEMFHRYVKSAAFSEANVQENLLKLHGFYKLAKNQLDVLEKESKC